MRYGEIKEPPVSVPIMPKERKYKDMDTYKEKAAQKEQQLKLKEKVSDEIIRVLVENNLTISEAENILDYTSNKLRKQIKVSF